MDTVGKARNDRPQATHAGGDQRGEVDERIQAGHLAGGTILRIHGL
jgi:hypothetical protein